jgi:OOP family OmpA-OmpF porin
MQKKLGFMVLGVALVMPLAAHAEGSYVKLGVGQSEYKVESESENKTATSIAYGFSVNKNFGVEVGYVNFGKIEASAQDIYVSAKNQSFYLAGVGTLALTDAFSIYGKLGATSNRFEVGLDMPGLSGTARETKTRPLLGVGLAYNFTKDIAGTLEYQQYGKALAESFSLSTLTAGVKYNF